MLFVGFSLVKQICIAFGIYSSFKIELTAFISQHSGLWNVNPGDAVRMESGETIAQWRKLYFQKFGVGCLCCMQFLSRKELSLCCICIYFHAFVYHCAHAQVCKCVEMLKNHECV